jgi:hypothetical protein
LISIALAMVVVGHHPVIWLVHPSHHSHLPFLLLTYPFTGLKQAQSTFNQRFHPARQMIPFGEANPELRKKERRKSLLLKKNLRCTVDLQ